MSDSLESILVGQSAAMVRLRRDIVRIAATPISVLIEGETGTGKELVAGALHRLSGRRGAFVPVNVASIPESMFEAHVFGHVRGAFTGAVGELRGFVQEARAGTLFLDEVSAMPIALQPKLLRVIESGTVRPLGAQSDRATDFRLVAAANSSLHAEMASQRFRSDLLYRICGDLLRVPALRDRAEDVAPLSQHFVARYNHHMRSSVSLSGGALRALQAFDWPGNVRQLRAVVERVALGAESCEVRAEEIAETLERLAPRPYSVAPLSSNASDLLRLLQRFAWDTVRVAAELGVTRKTVYAWIQKYDLSIPGKHTRRVANSRQASFVPSSPGAGSVPPDSQVNPISSAKLDAA